METWADVCEIPCVQKQIEQTLPEIEFSLIPEVILPNTLTG